MSIDPLLREKCGCRLVLLGPCLLHVVGHAAQRQAENLYKASLAT
jgi:hypothetical protein